MTSAEAVPWQAAFVRGREATGCPDVNTKKKTSGSVSHVKCFVSKVVQAILWRSFENV